MKKNLAFLMAVAALVMLLAWTGQVRAYEVTGDVTSGWGTTGGSLWYNVFNETASSGSGTAPFGVIVRPEAGYLINSTLHNWVEGDFVVVTGMDGERALYSIGELDPGFGNETVTLTLTKDKKGYNLAGAGRAIGNVADIDVVHAVDVVKGAYGSIYPYSIQLVVSGEGIAPKKYELADLLAMKQVTFNASSSTTNTVGVWTGPTLVDVLKASGVDTTDMDSYIVVVATDAYATVVSMYEATHMITNTQTELPLLATSGVVSGSDEINCGSSSLLPPTSSTSSCAGDGFVRLVLPEHAKAGTWVSNVYAIMVHKYHEKACK
ncbi:MAG: hypothetical protein ABSC19_16345 [Syntrophorhabdales bacterium]|jgi:hypothetical protein